MSMAMFNGYVVNYQWIQPGNPEILVILCTSPGRTASSPGRGEGGPRWVIGHGPQVLGEAPPEPCHTETGWLILFGYMHMHIYYIYI